MKWSDRGDSYVLEATVTDPIGMDYQGNLWQYRTEVMLVSPAVDEKGIRHGWNVYEAEEPRLTRLNPYIGHKINDTPYPRVDQAKAVAVAWWRMK